MFEEYSILVRALRTDVADFCLLVASDIGGRWIATLRFAVPIEVGPHHGGSGSDQRIIEVIEIPSPKDGSPYPAGLEHVEVVIFDGSHKSPMNSDVHQSALGSWMVMHPCVRWSIKALG